jgi:hypothetical protein
LAASSTSGADSESVVITPLEKKPVAHSHSTRRLRSAAIR